LPAIKETTKRRNNCVMDRIFASSWMRHLNVLELN
jgi:hypothetical protein